MRILLDMDDVLADFYGGFLDFCRRENGWGQPKLFPQNLENNRKKGEWDLVKAFGINNETFRAVVCAGGPDFWKRLKPTRYLPQIVGATVSFTDDWYIVSDPCRFPHAVEGKLHWLRTHFGNTFTQYVFTGHKHLLAGPDVVLVDDKEESVEKFKEAGGRGILCPTLGNRLHGLFEDGMTAEYVVAQLDSIAKKDQRNALSL